MDRDKHIDPDNNPSPGDPATLYEKIRAAQVTAGELNLYEKNQPLLNCSNCDNGVFIQYTLT